MRRLLPALLAAAGLLACGGGSPSQPDPSPGPTPTPPAETRIARGPYLQSAPEGSLTVAWYLEAATVGRVEWRPEGGSWRQATSSEGVATRHEALLTGLEPGTGHSYRVLGRGAPLPDLEGRTEFAFRTPRRDVFKMAVVGDPGSGDPPQYAVAARIAAESPLPDLVLIPGDVMYPHGEAEGYDSRFFAPYRSLLSAIPFYAALGNHDYETAAGQPWLDVFTLPRNGPPGLRPETAFFFERASPAVRVIVHDSNASRASLEAEALPWHDSVARPPTTFRIACLHHPPFASGLNANVPPTPTIRALFPPAFTASGIDVALSGHEHFYERTRPVEGVVYVTTGNGGMDLYPRTVVWPFSAVFNNTVHGHTTIEIQGRQLTLRHTASDGRAIDSLVLSKPVVAGEGHLSVSSGRETRTVARFHLERAWDVSWALLRVRARGDFVASVNDRLVARGRPAARGDGFQVFDVPPSRLRRGENGIVVELRAALGAHPEKPLVELVLASEPTETSALPTNPS